jgi:MFS family permease
MASSLPLLDMLNPTRQQEPLSRLSRYTARFHLPAAGLDGLVAGLFTLNDIVLRKTFGAGPLLITLLVMAAPVSQLLAIVWGNLMHGRPKRPFILGFGGGGRMLLVFVGLATSAVAFTIPVIVSIGLAVAIIPALNALYQTNYADAERGRVFGLIMSVTAVATIGASLAAGWWMDHDPHIYRVLYPVAGVLGLLAAILYYRIRPRGPSGRGADDLSAADWLGAVTGAVRNPFKGARTLFRDDPNFFRFEMSYMLYGMAFMILQPVLPFFLVDEIQVQYSEAATARGLLFWGVVAILSPFFGRMLDRWNAVRVSIVGFSILTVFPVLLAVSTGIGGVYAAFTLYGAAMAAVNIAWTMGPILFAGKKDAASYMGVHVTMVGIRGLIGNPVGLLLFQTIGSRATFLVSSGFFVAAVVTMWRLHRRMRAAAVLPGAPPPEAPAAAA